ncbi:restriction endonuclease [Enterocloster clostridioformis]
MMFNLESLNDYEFEILCKDILEKILDIELYTFAKGRDGGIDICDAKTHPTIIAQAKHYYKSSFQQLLSSLKKEIDRVSENVRLKKFYVCTSQSLTQKNKNEIFSCAPSKGQLT